MNSKMRLVKGEIAGASAVTRERVRINPGATVYGDRFGLGLGADAQLEVEKNA
jgi:hypothetical protein